MVVKYTNFSDGVHYFELSKAAKSLSLSDFFIGDVKLRCKLDKSPHQLVFDCETEVESIFDCDRCNSEYSFVLKNNFKLIYLFSKEIKDSEDISVKYISPETDKVDLSQDVAEFIMLAVPLKKLCKDECKGLCSQCGKNLNNEQCNCIIESAINVWEPLQKLKNKLNN